ncbi:MAG: 4Fe-4S binding protein [Candidatus Bathyarchaeota archaeon]|nr:MAG: 4Fe-4S binding protein [Candidatus Bathyarchaeota archaeon]
MIVFFLLFNAILFGVEPISLILPVLQSQGNPAETIGDAFAIMQHMLWETVFPWLPLASFLIVAVLLGRALCGWACPFGLIQEMLGYVKRRHTEISSRTHKDLIYVKYLILGVTLFISVAISITVVSGTGRAYKEALGVFAQAPFNALSPHDTLFATIPSLASKTYSGLPPYDNLLGALGALSPVFWTRLFILALVIAFAVYTPRSWCLYICPVGALMALLNRFSFLGLKRDVVRCTKEGCRNCVDKCPMKVPILDLPWEKFTHPECIYCLECVDACSAKALKPKFP